MHASATDSDTTRPGAVLLVSLYELGHQPQALAVAAAFLEAAGYQPTLVDLAVEPLTDECVDRADFVALSVPMHTALRMARPLARRIRARNNRCRIVFFGHYALLHADTLLAAEADAVLGGECEADLVALLQGDRSDEASAVPRVSLRKLDFPVPSRRQLPALSRYARLQTSGEHRLAGHLETTRGCRHLCRHCPVPAVYEGRLFAVQRDIVLQDARQQVAVGARHLTFGDADFLNAPGHGVRILQDLHREFPQLTFDFTAKIEHLIEHAELLPGLADAGVLFVVSAVETLNNDILMILDKGHTRDDVDTAQGILADCGIAMRPSLLPFTPWTRWRDIQDILMWIAESDLVDHVDAVQYSIRLLVPRGSRLAEHAAFLPHRGDYDEESLTFGWRHQDKELDALQVELRRLAERASQLDQGPDETFDAMWGLVQERRPPSVRSARRPESWRVRRRPAPERLTEPWFC